MLFLGKALHPQMLHLTQVKMSTWLDWGGNVYDKLNAQKRLQDCMLSVELKWHTNKQCSQGKYITYISYNLSMLCAITITK